MVFIRASGPFYTGIKVRKEAGEMKIQTVFGPVPSRRLGQSLGVDTIPLKTCNWNCVYCQLGRTIPVTNERKEYYPRQEILAEIKKALDSHAPGDIDWITFVGSGEPTLHVGLGWLIANTKTMTDIPVAVITNGALLYMPEVRQELLPADAIMPSLDAGTPLLYRRLNRPHPAITFERLVGGLISFRQIYQGSLWVQVMLMRGLNDTEETLEGIAAVLKQIHADQVHLILPNRPPTETWVHPSDEEGIMRAQAILGRVATVVHPARGSFDLSGSDNVVDAIIGIITRHPMRETELEDALQRWAPGQVETVLTALQEDGRAKLIERLGIRFWSGAPAHFPDDVRSMAARPKRKRSAAFEK
jgi:wyosine [tRNA(Phe)-imidazoG37] synthetase (radical SAM superfamily)